MDIQIGNPAINKSETEELLHAVKTGAGGKPQNYDPATGRFGPALGFVEKAGNTVSSGTKTAAEASSKVSSSTKYNKKARSMTDEELKRAIERMELEQHYSRLNPSTTSRGAASAATILSAIGSVAAVAASIATVAIAAKELKKS